MKKRLTQAEKYGQEYLHTPAHTLRHLLSLNSLVDSLALKAKESKSPGNSTKAKTISLLLSKKALVKNKHLGKLVVKLLIEARFELGVIFQHNV